MAFEEDILQAVIIFQLSRDLAPRDIGYRRMKTYSVTAHESDDSSNPPPEALPQWIDAKGLEEQFFSR